MAKIHIVLATYNGEKYLAEQLDSLRTQTYEDFDVEICDDGSTDSTVAIAKEYCEKDKRFSVHSNEKNRGYVKNFLEGIRRSQAEYIMLCDQDDIWNPDKIQRTWDRMQQLEHNNFSVPLLVFSDAMNYNSDSNKTMGRFHENSHLDTKKIDSAHLFMENKCIGCTVMVNQYILPYLSQFPDEIRVHDWWLALICSHFGKIGYMDEPTLLYRQHSGNMIGGSSFSTYVKERLAGIRKQKAALRQTYEQGAAFYQLFGQKMDSEQKETAFHFSQMSKVGWWKRRQFMLHYGFQKSGFVRNAGLFLFM